jgi:3-phosphoshikimate 1-carboxyvinyltransferase
VEKTYHREVYKGKLAVPLSKSYTQRAIAIASLCVGETEIINPAFCDDTYAALEIARGLGAQTKIESHKIYITGNFRAEEKIFSAGESGLAVRMFSPILALLDESVSISGKGSLLKRPVSMVETALEKLGVSATSKNGFLPLKIKGPLTGGECTIDGSLSSQVLTGLLIALPVASHDSRLMVRDLQSKPYIDMTLEIISSFGVTIENRNYKEFIIKGNQKYIARKYEVEGDWSNAAFHLVGGVMAGNIELTGLNPNSKQADVAILRALEKAAAKVRVLGNKIVAEKSEPIGFDFDATHCPDLFPPLAVLAASCHGTSTISGVDRLIYKESNRAISLQAELSKLGVHIKLEGNNMVIQGGRISGGEISSHNDHRIAMAGAIAGLVSENPVTIKDAEAVNKSYPDFFIDFENLIQEK